MAPRLYHTVRRVYAQVARALARLGLVELGTPMMAALIGLHVTGLILLDVRQTQSTRDALPASVGSARRAHHVGIVLLTVAALQMLRRHRGEAVGAVKERYQLRIARDDDPLRIALKACPAYLRATALVL